MSIDVRLPRVYDDKLNFLREARPIKLSLTLSIIPLSYASMQLPWGESLPARGYVEIFTSMGSAGFFRVRSPQEAYGDDLTTSELEHAIVEVGDYLVLGSYNEMMPAKTAMRTLFSHYRGSKWKLGNVDALGNDQVALQSDHERVLEAMIALLEQKPDCMMSFDFSTTPWTVNIVKRGTVVSAEGRLSRNINAAKVAYDDTELVTRCYYEYSVPGSGSTEPSTAWAYIDTDTKSKYGLVERTAPSMGSYTQAEARAAAVAYAEKHKNPRVSVTISAEELSYVTGESFDTFTIGKLCRLALLDYNVTIEQVITGLAWDDVLDVPEDITVVLEDEEDTTVTFLHDLDAKGGAGGGGGGRKKQEDVWKAYYTHFDKQDHYIDMWARHVDEANNILQQAGLYLDSDGVLAYADDNVNMWASKLKVESDRIGLVVSGTGANARIRPAEIVASINGSGSTIKISADHVDIQGALQAYTGFIAGISTNSLHSEGDIDAMDEVKGYTLNSTSGEIVAGSYTAEWQETSVVTGLGTLRSFTYGGFELRAFNGTGATTTKKTLHYLGRAAT